MQVFLQEELVTKQVVRNKRDNRAGKKKTFAETLARSPFYVTSNSIYGSSQSTIGRYGLNYKSDGILSETRSIDPSAERMRSGL